MHFPQPPATSSLVSKYSSQHYVLKHPHSMMSSYNVRGQVLHLYKTGKMIVLYDLVFMFFSSRWVCDTQHSTHLKLSLIKLIFTNLNTINGQKNVFC